MKSNSALNVLEALIGHQRKFLMESHQFNLRAIFRLADFSFDVTLKLNNYLILGSMAGVAFVGTLVWDIDPSKISPEYLIFAAVAFSLSLACSLTALALLGMRTVKRSASYTETMIGLSEATGEYEALINDVKSAEKNGKTYDEVIAFYYTGEKQIFSKVIGIDDHLAHASAWSWAAFITIALWTTGAVLIALSRGLLS